METADRNGKVEHWCKRHTAGQKRRRESEAKWKVERDASTSAQAVATRAKRLLAERGIQSSEHFEWRTGRYTGAVVIAAEDVVKLLASVPCD